MKTGQEVKEILRTAGIPTKSISVKVDHLAYKVKIKDLALDIVKIDELLIPLEFISYCKASGEILGGANSYVFVEYDYDLVQRVAKEKENEVMDDILRLYEGRHNVSVLVAALSPKYANRWGVSLGAARRILFSSIRRGVHVLGDGGQLIVN